VERAVRVQLGRSSSARGFNRMSPSPTDQPDALRRGRTVTKNIDDVLAAEAAAGEDDVLPDVLPDGVEVSRPHVGRPQVVSVRLSHGELEQLTHAAEAAHLPVSTFIRIAAVSHVHAHGEGALADVTRRLARLERAVFERVE